MKKPDLALALIVLLGLAMLVLVTLSLWGTPGGVD
jgi:hypothetical protein